jgi:sporulation protein YlmC with PRC-barrel domain
VVRLIDLIHPGPLNQRNHRGGQMTQLDELVAVRILPADRGAPAGKLADIELHFTSGALEGLKLLGFTVWEGRGDKCPSVSLPAKHYVVNGERRTFTLLRPTSETQTPDALRTALVAAFVDQHRPA